MDHHNGLTRSKERYCEFGMENDINPFPATSVRDGNLVPSCLVLPPDPNFSNILMIREGTQVGWVGIEQNIFVVFVEPQKFLDNVLSVYSHPAPFVNRTQHDADAHVV